MVKAFILATALVATFAAAEIRPASPAPAPAPAASPVDAIGYVMTSSHALIPGTRGPVIQL